MIRQIQCALISMAVCGAVARAEGTDMDKAINAKDTVTAKTILESNPNAANEPNAAGCLPLYNAMGRNDDAMVQLLLAHKADPNLKNRFGYSSIYYALAHDGKRTYLKLFLEHGANVDDQDKEGNSLLYYAVEGNLPDCVKLLLSYKANVDLQNKAGNAPLHAACGLGKWSPVLELLLAKGPNVNLAGRYGETPLLIAIRRGDAKLVRLLLDHKADPNQATTGRTTATPLHICATYATPGAGDVATMLLAAKVDPNCRDQHGKTPLHYAAEHNSVAVAKVLVAAGADVNARDTRYNRTPLEDALISKAFPNTEIRQYLQSLAPAKDHRP